MKNLSFLIIIITTLCYNCIYAQEKDCGSQPICQNGGILSGIGGDGKLYTAEWDGRGQITTIQYTYKKKPFLHFKLNGKPWPNAAWGISKASCKLECKDIENSCIELEKEIYVLKTNIEKNSVAYNKIFLEVENFDKSTRLNFCTQDHNHYIQYGILEYDESWNNYFTNLNKNIGLLGKIPVLSSAVDVIGKLISGLIVGAEAMETKQMPVDEAIEEYNRVREVRKTVFDNLIDLLNKYYCNNIFQDDQRLYELYNNIIPNSSLCDDHEKQMLQQEITRNRPDGLPAAIWEEHIFQSTKKNCQ